MKLSLDRMAILPMFFLFSGCQVIGTIFKAGVWTGLTMVGLCTLVLFGAFRLFQRR